VEQYFAPQQAHQIGGIAMGKRNKSKRFVQQGVDTVSKHDERIPYHMTYAEAEAQKMANVRESSLGGI
jgi:hypothetical protein